MTAAVALVAVSVAACEETTPTSIDASRLPEEPVTLEVQLPWAEFASNLEVFGGYGAPIGVRRGVVARTFAGTLDARALLRFVAYPQAAVVVDTTGTTRTDSNLSFVGARLVAFFDTIASSNAGPVTLALGALQEEWDPVTTTWTFAADEIGDQRAWPEVGAGPVTALDTAVWDPAAGDSVSFVVDSATVAAWSITEDASRGARVELLTDGVRLEIRSVLLRLDVRPSLDPDTLIELTVTGGVTFVYDPLPLPPPDGFRIGGAPAWRSVLDIALADSLTGPPALCEAVGCPFRLRPQHIDFAALVLTSRRTEDAFQPTDSIRLDARAVFSRAALPKSPLGRSLIPEVLGKPVGPEAFGAQEGELVEIPLTSFLEALLGGPDADGFPPPNTLALLSILEPLSFSFASFHGPGGPDAPFLSLILTVSRPLELP